MPTSDDLCWMPASEMAPAIKRRKLSPVEVTKAVLTRIERLNPRLNAFVTLTAEQALKDARAAERAVMKKGAKLGPLHGVPFSTKDLVITKGVRTTFGTRLFADNVPTEDAPMVGRMRAAVAAGMGPLAIGTDGGGSIRIPASLAGIYGIKPTYGLVPIYPFSAAWGLSHIGPMTRTVADAALMLNAAAGPDARDPFSLPGPRVDYVKALRGGVKGLRVAWTADLGFAKVVDPEVAAACERAARRFRELGCRVEQVTPKWPSPQAAWRTMFLGGIAARLGPALRERRDDIDPGLAAIADETRTWSPTQFVQAWFDRLAWEEHPRRLFERYDLLLTPTIACAAFKVGLDSPSEIAGTPTGIYDWIPFTYPFNMTGHPGASVPCGFTSDKLPIGLQILGRRFEDATVLRASAAFEKIAPWAHLRPRV